MFLGGIYTALWASDTILNWTENCLYLSILASRGAKDSSKSMTKYLPDEIETLVLYMIFVSRVLLLGLGYGDLTRVLRSVGEHNRSLRVYDV